jgi:hypothetical protein
MLALVGVISRFLSRPNRRMIVREDIYNIRSYLRLLLLLDRNLPHSLSLNNKRYKARISQRLFLLNRKLPILLILKGF